MKSTRAGSNVKHSVRRELKALVPCGAYETPTTPEHDREEWPGDLDDDIIDPANWPAIVEMVRRLPTLPDDPDLDPEPAL